MIPEHSSESSQDLLRAVSGRDVGRHQPVVERTRRAIRIADESRREQGVRDRRTTGIALFTLGALFVMLAPALWTSLDDLVGGEHFGDLPMQVVLLSTVLLLAVVAALAAGWRTRAGQDEFQSDPRNLL